MDLVRRVVERLAVDAAVERVVVDSPQGARALGFLGSPTVRVNGRDLEGCGGVGELACRRYEGDEAPPEWMVEAAVVRAVRPSGVLFLCVANSARSQIAEGIARSLAPSTLRIWSAGSQPTNVRPEAIAVLAEIQIDISGYRSKSVTEIPPAEVDTVITLCAEEECPVFLGRARRLHWGLPDPAATVGNPEDRLAAFRHTRNELRRRIVALFASENG